MYNVSSIQLSSSIIVPTFHIFHISKGTQNTNLKRHMLPYAHYSIIYYSQNLYATKVSINRQMDKEVHIYNGILLSHKKNEILPLVKTWMDLEGIMVNKISQTEKDNCHIISFTCGI